jgi:hypothetical protein
MSIKQLLITAFLSTIAVFLIGTVHAADCVSIPNRDDYGKYQGCEVVHGSDVQMLDAEETPESACAKACESVGEMDQLATESMELDLQIGSLNIE